MTDSSKYPHLPRLVPSSAAKLIFSNNRLSNLKDK